MWGQPPRLSQPDEARQIHLALIKKRMCPRHQLKFRKLPGFYAIVRLAPDAPLPEWANGDFNSITRTANELSIVCPTDKVPEEIDAGPRWICLMLEGPFPFSQTGILLSFIEPLSANGIPIFAMSTYDTDYVLVQEEFLERAFGTLQSAGHERADLQATFRSI